MDKINPEGGGLRAMRAAIFELAHGHDFNRRIAASPPLIRAVLIASERNGYSGEDTMTWLAYQALSSYEKLFDHTLAMANLSPPAAFYYVPKSPEGRDAGIEGAFK